MPTRMIVIRSLRYLLASVVAGLLVAATSVLAEEQLNLPSPTMSPSGGRPSLLMPITSAFGAGVPLSDSITGDPQTYYYHPKTALGLGLGFDPAASTTPKLPCIVAKKVPIDPGAVSTNLSMTYVRSWDQLNIAMKVDTKADASYLAFKGNSSFSMDTSTTFQSNAITVVMTASSDFGRWGLDADAKLTDEAKTLLANGQEFARVCGTRYVAFERRGASVSAVITLLSTQSDFKASFDAEFGGSGGWGPLSASAQAKFHSALSNAAQQARINVQVGATGGVGLAALQQTVEKLASVEKDPINAIFGALGASLNGFTKDNASPVEYTVAPMDFFGWNPATIDPWNDLKERKLRALVLAYREAGIQLDSVTAMENGSFPLNKVLPKSLIDDFIHKKPSLLSYIQGLADAHKKCKDNKNVIDCDVPLGKVTIIDETLQHLLDPPRVNFNVRGVDSNNKVFEFTSLRAAVIVKSKRSNRLTVAQSFVHDTARVVIGLNVDGWALATVQEIFQYQDGHTVKSDETGGVGGFLWAEEPRETVTAHKNYYENKVYEEFLGKHDGSFEGSEIIQVRDEMGRIFRLTIFHAKWTANGKNVTSIEMEILN
jgi:hypothetical protein